jgi:branched-chain amino acid transport system ATP-binding protein
MAPSPRRGLAPASAVSFILEARSLVKSFDGFRAVDGVNLRVERGSVHALIGPNGAGKTTLFYLLSGFVHPTSGQILLGGCDIAGFPPQTIARHGLVCAFQISHLFPRLSAVANVECAVLARRGQATAFWRRIDADTRREALETLEAVGLADLAGQPAGTLSHGDQRVLEIAVTLATRPSVLLLDEPTAGMSPVETLQTVALIRRLARDRGLTVLLVEHDMSVVFSISDRVTVLHQGAVLREGRPEEIRADAAVVEVYLGEPV